MSSYYTVSIGNKFGNLEESDSDDEGLPRPITLEAHIEATKKTEVEKPKRKGKKEQEIEEAPKGEKDAKPASQSPTRTERGGRGGRGGGRAGRGGRGGGPNSPGDWSARQEGTEDVTGLEGSRGENYRGGRGGRRGGGGDWGQRKARDDGADWGTGWENFVAENWGNDSAPRPAPRGRGGRGRGGAETQRGREFDRRSGTGRGREMKKGGAGAYNWGDGGGEGPESPTNNAEEKEAGEELSDSQQVDAPNSAEKQGHEEEAEVAQVQNKAETLSMTLDELREEQRRKKLPTREGDKPKVLSAEELQKEGFFLKETAKEMEHKDRKGDDDGVEVKHKRGGVTMHYYEYAAKNGNDVSRRGRERGKGRGRMERNAEQRPLQPMMDEDMMNDLCQFPALATK